MRPLLGVSSKVLQDHEFTVRMPVEPDAFSGSALEPRRPLRRASAGRVGGRSRRATGDGGGCRVVAAVLALRRSFSRVPER